MQCIFCFFDKLRLKSGKACFLLSTLYTHSSQQSKIVVFPKTIATIGWAMSCWPIIQSHTDNTWLKCRQKKKGLHQLFKNAAHSNFPRMDECDILPFKRLINRFSGISTIRQPRSNTALQVMWPHSLTQLPSYWKAEYSGSGISGRW